MTISRRLPRASLLAAVLAAGCGGAGTSTPAPDAGGSFQPVATVSQIMQALVVPASDRVFEAVVYDNGELTTQPETLDDWAQLEYAAITLAESGNLLMVPDRQYDAGAWVERSRELIDTSVAVLQAARRQDLDGVLETGSALYEACLNCHNAYVPPDVP